MNLIISKLFEASWNSLTSIKTLLDFDEFACGRRCAKAAPQDGLKMTVLLLCWRASELLIGANTEITAGHADTNGVTGNHVDQAGD